MRGNLIVFAAVFLLFSGCIGEEWKVVAEPHEIEMKDLPPPEPERISLYVTENFKDFYGEEFNYSAEIVVYNKYYRSMAVNGSANFTIQDNSGNVLYNSSFQMLEEDFESEGIYGGLVYNWTIPYEDVKSSGDYSGTASVELTTSDGRVFHGESYVSPPQEKISEEMDEINVTKKLNGLELTVVGAGEYDGFYNDYKILIMIKNAGPSVKYVNVKDAVLVVDGKQFEGERESYISGGELYPTAYVEEGLLFSGVPENITGDAILYVNTYKDEFSSETTMYGIEFELK